MNLKIHDAAQLTFDTNSLEKSLIDLACTIDSVTVEGCRKDKNSKACRVKRNVNAGINIEFTPDFDGSDITMMAYALMPGIEKSFPDMNPDACSFTTCPVESGKRQTYSFGLKMAPTYPLVSSMGCQRVSILIEWSIFRVCSTSDF